jgi:hypothetical protein
MFASLTSFAVRTAKIMGLRYVIFEGDAKIVLETVKGESREIYLSI